MPKGGILRVIAANVTVNQQFLHGPFVMNTTKENEQALKDFQNPPFLEGLTSHKAQHFS